MPHDDPAAVLIGFSALGKDVLGLCGRALTAPRVDPCYARLLLFAQASARHGA
jgi:hypothetical protein